MNIWVIVALVIAILLGLPTAKIKAAIKATASKIKAYASRLMASRNDAGDGAGGHGCPWRLVVSLCLASAVIGRASDGVPMPALPAWLSGIVDTVTPDTTGPLVVMMLHESTRPDLLTDSQREMLASDRIDEYLDAHCRKLDGQPAHRILDHEADLSKDHEVFQELKKQPRDNPNWLYVSNGKSGYSGPLPENEDEALTILKKYGGE